MSGTEPHERVGPVSVVICNYQGEGYLVACLDGLRALEDEVDEILLVDNASTDGGVALVERDYPEVRVVQVGWNSGPGTARNVGMREARNRFVLCLDNDVIVRPDVLGKLKAALDARPDAAIVAPRSVFKDEPTRVHYDGGAFHYVGLISLRNFYVPLAEAVGEGTLEIDVAISLCQLVDKEAVLAAGGYDDSFFILFEDVEMAYRVRMAGHVVLYEEDAIVLHDAGTPGISFREGARYPATRIQYHSRNRWLFLLKCYRVRTLILISPALAVYELVWFLFSVKKGGFFPWMWGKLALFRDVPVLWRNRRAAQRMRRVRDRDLLVGGPITITPTLTEGSGGRMIRALDTVLRAWWSVVGRFVA